MKKYLAIVRVVKHYEIGFESPNFKQAFKAGVKAGERKAK